MLIWVYNETKISLKPGPNKDWELTRVQTLVWPETLMHSHQIFFSHQIWTCSNFSWELLRVSLVWPMLHDSRWELKKTVKRAFSHQLSSSLGPGFKTLTDTRKSATCTVSSKLNCICYLTDVNFQIPQVQRITMVTPLILVMHNNETLVMMWVKISFLFWCVIYFKNSL